MTSQLEKVFMHWIFKNPQNFKWVKPHFFGNEEVKFIYDVVLEEWNRSNNGQVATLKEIATLVNLKDVKGKISPDLLKVILKMDWTEFTDGFVAPRFKAWVLSNTTINGLVDSIEVIKGTDKTDYDKVIQNLEQIKSNIFESTSLNMGDIDIGSDFDDPDAHNQLSYANKISTGFPTMNAMLNGGWDRKTLNILMLEVNNGKSLMMQNFSVNAANAGYNVGIVTLEMSEKKVLKRVGSMRLNIPINQYDDLSKDREYMKERIDAANRSASGNGVFDSGKGRKIYVKEFGTGAATVADISDWVKLVQEVTGNKLDVLVVDYIQIMKPESRLNIDNMLYLKGKHFAEGLRMIAKQFDLVVISATQLDKSKYGALDITLADMPESKAIADTADTVWAGIRTAQMKIEKRYHLKPLKFRDNEIQYERIELELNTYNLKLENDKYIENVL